MESISFDFAADVYDATRAFPEGVAEKVVGTLISALPQNPDILEVGIGTGRISRPLLKASRRPDAEQGEDHPRIFGIDVSPRMLARLQAQLESHTLAPHLVLGSGLALPFPQASIDAVLMVHFIHLVQDWKAALLESRRVLKHYGDFFIGYETGLGDTPVSRIRKKLQELRLEYIPDCPQYGPDTPEERNEWLVSNGAVQEVLEAATWNESSSVGETIDTYAQGIHSSTWLIPPDTREAMMDRLRVWALEQFGSLDLHFEATRRFVWERFRWN